MAGGGLSYAALIGVSLAGGPVSAPAALALRDLKPSPQPSAPTPGADRRPEMLAVAGSTVPPVQSPGGMDFNGATGHPATRPATPRATASSPQPPRTQPPATAPPATRPPQDPIPTPNPSGMPDAGPPPVPNQPIAPQESQPTAAPATADTPIPEPFVTIPAPPGSPGASVR
ncbi:hypothetical protein [Micromonospora sp. NPDC049679]|uniref:hypothetical protein n=1 Tax=Micromonospora sp. NPDC049679 TaxID=3155920 RepID=UPI0033E000FD